MNEGKRVAHVYPRKLRGVQRRFSFVLNGVRTWHAGTLPGGAPAGVNRFGEAQAKALRGMVRP